MEESPLFLEDETLTDNLTDDSAGRLLKLAENIWKRLPECVDSFVKVVRLVNKLPEVGNYMERDDILAKIVWMSGIKIGDLQLPMEVVIDNIVKELEKNYGS